MVGTPHPYGCQCVDCLPPVRFNDTTNCFQGPNTIYISANQPINKDDHLKELADLKREVQRLRTENFQLRNRQHRR
jgi:hypothetical protein